MTPRSIIKALRKGELSQEEAHERMRQIFNPQTNGYKPSAIAIRNMQGYVKPENRR